MWLVNVLNNFWSNRPITPMASNFTFVLPEDLLHEAHALTQQEEAERRHGEEALQAKCEARVRAEAGAKTVAETARLSAKRSEEEALLQAQQEAEAAKFKAQQELEARLLAEEAMRQRVEEGHKARLRAEADALREAEVKQHALAEKLAKQEQDLKRRAEAAAATAPIAPPPLSSQPPSLPAIVTPAATTPVTPWGGALKLPRSQPVPPKKPGVSSVFKVNPPSPDEHDPQTTTPTAKSNATVLGAAFAKRKDGSN